MAVLDQIMQLKNQGMSDSQIINNLRQQGISPNEINNAISQAEIKNAVAGDYQEPMAQEINEEYPPQENYEPQVDYNNQQNYPPQEEYYPQEGYEGQENYAGQNAGFDSSTIIEIAEQVFSEKIKKIEKKVEELNEFKTLNKAKIENIDERLKKIESVIDKLQIAILEKVGSYGQNLGEIKKEMNMMQDSFGKMVNNIADKNSTPISSKRIPRKDIE
jgi:DNA-binding transcriptional MerR regulator